MSLTSYQAALPRGPGNPMYLRRFDLAWLVVLLLSCSIANARPVLMCFVVFHGQGSWPCFQIATVARALKPIKQGVLMPSDVGAVFGLEPWVEEA